MSTTLQQLSNDLAAAVDRAAQAVVSIHARRRIPSTGVIWQQGIVVSADHTVRKDDDITITLSDGTEVLGRVIGRDATSDLCILRIESDRAPATIETAPVRVGQLVFSVGRPGDAATASLGVVSVQLRPVRVRIPAGTSATTLGLLVLTVDPAGAAGRAGLQQGDILLGHAGRPFTSHADLTSLLRDAGPGAVLRFDVGRGGRRVSCEVLLDAMVGNTKHAA